MFELICALKSDPLALAGCSTSIDVTDGVVVGVVLGVAVGCGVAVAFATDFVACAVVTAVGVAVGTLLADGLGLLVAGDVQPLIDTRAREPIKSKGNAYLSGVLIYRFIILIIGFTIHPPISKKQIRETGSMKLKSCYLHREHERRRECALYRSH